MKNLLMIIIPLFMFGIGQVNNSYIDMTNNDNDFLPEFRKISENILEITGFGMTAVVDTEHISQTMNEVKYNITTKVQNTYENMAVGLGLKEEEEEPSREAYGVEVL